MLDRLLASLGARSNVGRGGRAAAAACEGIPEFPPPITRLWLAADMSVESLRRGVVALLRCSAEVVVAVVAQLAEVATADRDDEDEIT